MEVTLHQGAEIMTKRILRFLRIKGEAGIVGLNVVAPSVPYCFKVRYLPTLGMCRLPVLAHPSSLS